MGLTVNRQVAKKLTVNRQKRNIFTDNRQMSGPKLSNFSDILKRSRPIDLNGGQVMLLNCHYDQIFTS